MVSFDCPKCGVSDVVKRGKRKNKSGVKQLYRCNGCRKVFVEPDGFERMRYNAKTIVRAFHMHADGLSLSKVQNHLWQHDGVKVTRSAIASWVKKYSIFLKSSNIRSKTGYKRKNSFR